MMTVSEKLQRLAQHMSNEELHAAIDKKRRDDSGLIIKPAIACIDEIYEEVIHVQNHQTQD